MSLTTNSAGIALIKISEGVRLDSYRDVAGVWTIGYGHTTGVTQGRKITQAQADQLLAQDLASFERGVVAAADDPSSNEFAAMVSLAFNIGLGGFRGSTVLRQHNAGNKDAAGKAFLMWNKAHVDGQLVTLAGLTKRREAERMLYLTPDTAPSPIPTLPDPNATYPVSGQLVMKDGKPSSMTITFGSIAEE